MPDDRADAERPAATAPRLLVWFRNDLRVRDNPALHAACERAAATGGEVVAAFLPAPVQWRRHDWSPWKVDLLRRSLVDLRGELQQRGIGLRLRVAPTFGEAAAVLVRLLREQRCAAVFCNREYEVDEQRRDAAVAAACAAEGIGFAVFTDQVLVEPAVLQSGAGAPYVVYTPFQKALLAHLAREGLPRLLGEPPPVRRDRRESDAVPAQFDGFAVPARGAEAWPAGELAALRRLAAFGEERLARYRADRDFPALDGSSGMSPYLALGVVAVRRCVESARVRNGGRLAGGGEGPDTWISQLGWREFYRHIVAHFPRVCMHRPFRLATEQVRWRDDDDDFAAWCEGRTGVPIVDAAMRCLMATGWMHNRLRMVVAQFFCKDLLLDWRRGERWFMQQLVDGDLANNNGGWQWSASTGTDAAPYFRIFNPMAQAKRFDADGAFVRQWLPELGTARYPQPIVDHGMARQRALQAFAAVR